MRSVLCAVAALLAGVVATDTADAGRFGRARAVCVGGNCGVSVNVAPVVQSVPVVVESVPQVIVRQAVPVIQERVQVNVDVPFQNRIIVRRGLFGRTIIRRGCR